MFEEKDTNYTKFLFSKLLDMKGDIEHHYFFSEIFLKDLSPKIPSKDFLNHKKSSFFGRIFRLVLFTTSL